MEISWSSHIGAFLRRLFNRPPETEPEPLSFPPPFERMLAINSDVEFTTWSMQLDLLHELAERKLETAFSFWFFGHSHTTWHIFNRDFSLAEEGAAALGLVKAGLMDTLHSFTGVHNGGGYQFDRGMIAQGFNQFEKAGVRIRVFSNHGTVDDIQNIGGSWSDRPGPIDFSNYQKGDVPGTERYHVDLTVKHGVRFFWVDIDRIRDVTWFQANAGDATGNLFISQICRDGTPILRFRRTDAMLDPDGAIIGQAINTILDAPGSGYSIIYTHLGVKRDPSGRPLVAQLSDVPSEVFDGLDRLAAEQDAGRVLVATTERLLTHALMSAARPWSISKRGKRLDVQFKRHFDFEGVSFEFDWNDYMGFCLEVKANDSVLLSLEGESKPAQRWSHNGVCYAGLPWQPLPMKSEVERAIRATSV